MEKYIYVPETDLKLCKIGLGALSAGIKWDGKAADDIIATYMDMGGNVIDTARVYQDWIPGEIGRSERAIGDWIKRSGKRNEITLMTKGGHPRMQSENDDIHISRMTEADMRHDLELSLKALNTDVIDVYFYHRDNVNQSIADEIEVMESFIKEGKIRYYSCSNWTAERMREADKYCEEHGYRGMVADQTFLNIGMNYMNPLSDDTLTYLKDDILEYHKENKKNLAMAYYTSADGYFHRMAKMIKEGSVTEATPSINETYDTPGNRKLAEKIVKLADKYDATITDVVLGYILTQDYPCLALFGPSSPARIAEAMNCLGEKIPGEAFMEIMA